jgi:hypothetical protein
VPPGLLAAAALLSLPSVLLPGAAAATPGGCGDADSRDFPLKARIRGGPDTYDAGGGSGAWSVDLTNTTDRTCTDIHPVVVLVDERRVLRAAQPRLELYDGGRPHPVRFETTDEHELVGPFDGFPGFTVAPGRTVTVRVRLALSSDAAPNEVVARAAVVRRRGEDGDWVGQSNDYRFRVQAPDPAPTSPAPVPPDPSATPDPARTSDPQRTPGPTHTPGPTYTPDPTPTHTPDPVRTPGPAHTSASAGSPSPAESPTAAASSPSTGSPVPVGSSVSAGSSDPMGSRGSTESPESPESAESTESTENAEGPESPAPAVSVTPPADELARTGHGGTPRAALAVVAVTAVLLVAAGGILVARGRR